MGETGVVIDAEGKQESSFCEQKEAKKFYSGASRTSGASGDSIFATGARSATKKFLRAFFKKRRLLAFFFLSCILAFLSGG